MLSRAEKFEDEKRRIVESCFTKQDASGGCTSYGFNVVLRSTDELSFSGRVVHHPHQNH